MIDRFRIRASYPNYYMLNLFANQGFEPFNHDSEDPANLLEGNKPGTVIYHLQGEPEAVVHEFPPRWYDMYLLLRSPRDERVHLLSLLLKEQSGEASPSQLASLADIRRDFHLECRRYIAAHPLHDSPELITPLSLQDRTEMTDEGISYKGRMLLELTRQCYPVPDFCIITSRAFTHPELTERLLDEAIANLEVMTHSRLGDDRTPLVFAIRCAMPQYIPGLMPTLLNIGVTRTAHRALMQTYGEPMAHRVYLSTLHSLSEMLGLSHRYEGADVHLTTADLARRIAEMDAAICAHGEQRLLTDAHYQALRLLLHVRQFYIDNSDLILTFMQGKQAYPSLILQRMVWTIGNNASYPGVLYSRHSRTGQGKQIESYRNIFGEEIMTGDVTTDDLAYADRTEIRAHFPAVYHFDPLLKKLEQRYRTPVTIEFAVETRPGEVSLFAVLQLNASEMTGRAALISAIDLRNEGLIDDAQVVDLIKPYHLRQIISASIDEQSFHRLQFFSHGLAVLPRTAISARLCFSSAKAHELKAEGHNVCLCQQHFVPEDTITLNEVEAILSIQPAAIHVVTACRGYGIPAFMDLQSHSVRLLADRLVNAEGVEIFEGEVITVSSKQQAIYKGEADFKPARFTKYLQGDEVELDPSERPYFAQMSKAYAQYQTIVTSTHANHITDITRLARLIRLNLQEQPEVATGIVNTWYEAHPDDYTSQVLESRMGDHNDQGRLFSLLDNAHKSDFLKRAYSVCVRAHRNGLTAGSFMIGRFVARPLHSEVWNLLDERIVAFLLNEYVMYEKYLMVLQEVGEIKLARAHSRIETEGIDSMTVSHFDLLNFVPLLRSRHTMPQVAEALLHIEHQDNTHLLVRMLSRPEAEIFDLSLPYKRAMYDDMVQNYC